MKGFCNLQIYFNLRIKLPLKHQLSSIVYLMTYHTLKEHLLYLVQNGIPLLKFSEINIKTTLLINPNKGLKAMDLP